MERTRGRSEMVPLDHLQLHHLEWREETAIRGILYIVHGLGEHIARYDRVACRLAREGFRVHGIDMPGHGRTSGHPKGHLGDFSQVARVIDRLLDFDRDLPLPKFLSLGGMNVARYVMEKRQSAPSGLILTSPAFGLPVPPNQFKVWMGRAFVDLLPSMTVDHDPRDISRIGKEVERYCNDPLVHRRISLRTADEMLSFQADLAKATRLDLSCPVLITHGTADRMTSSLASRKVFEKLTASDKTFTSYPVHSDSDAERVIDEWIAWLKAHS